LFADSRTAVAPAPPIDTIAEFDLSRAHLGQQCYLIERPMQFA
jgi:hypothetical protein